MGEDARDSQSTRSSADLDSEARTRLATDERATQTSSPLVAPLAELIKARLRQGAGDRVGRYVILRLLGEGGMGTVFAAYDEELDRKVAIKLLRPVRDPGVDHSWLLSEAKAMARLSHPNVVQVYDVGETDDQVFMAMELIPGATLRDWLRDAERPCSEILAAFVQAGRGLEAAHDAGLVHRDFKPQNVLIGEDGRVRVLDFGLAHIGADERAYRRSATFDTGAGGSRSTAGTPAYMSPEQHFGAEVDARSDQFSFAVALFEALFGTRPFVGKTSREIAAAIEAGAIPPPPASSRVPARIRRALLRALEIEPSARWPSMGALLDVLEDDPWRRRGRWLGLVGVTVAIVAIAVTVHRERARAAERAANQCAGGEAKLAAIWDAPTRDRVAEAMRATRLPFADDTAARVLAGIDQYADDWAALHRETCEEHRRGELSDHLYDRAQACLGDRRGALTGLVGVYAEADATVVERAMKGLAALPPLDRCGDPKALLVRVAPPEDSATATAVDETREAVAELRAEVSTGRVSGCDARFAPLLARARELDYRPLVAEIRYAEAHCAEQLGDYEGAELALLDAMFTAEASGAETTAAEAAIRMPFVVGYRRARYDEAALWGEHARALVYRRGDRDDELGRLDSALATLSLVQGRPEEALERFDAALPRLKRAFGEAHIEIAAVLNNRGAAYAALGRNDDLAASLEASLAISGEVLGPDHPDNALLLTNLGNLDYKLAKLDAAIEHHRRALDLKTRLLGSDHPDLAIFHNNLAGALNRRGDLKRAADHYRKAVAIREAALGPEHPDLANVLSNLGDTYVRLGDPARGRPLIERALAIREASQDPEHPMIAGVLTALGRCDVAEGHPAAAVARLERALRIHEARPGAPELIGDTRLALADALAAVDGDAARIAALADAAASDFTATGPLYADELARAEALRTRR